MKILNYGDKIAITACSNGIKIENSEMMVELVETLKKLGLRPVLSPKIYRNHLIYNGTDKEKADVLNNFFKDKEIKAIFDISGGDMANGLLEYLDYKLIKKNKKPFFGYSDLSVILNSLHKKSDIPVYLYQIRNLIGDFSEIQIQNFKNTFIDGIDEEITTLNYEWVQGNSMEGIVIGGNIRCFLKLAGTKYMPDFNNKVLLLESLSGDAFKMNTYLNQYKQLGVFKKVKGIILGSFTEMQNKNIKPDIISILKSKLDDSKIPIIKTNDIGHGDDSKCIIIGKNIIL